MKINDIAIDLNAEGPNIIKINDKGSNGLKINDNITKSFINAEGSKDIIMKNADTKGFNNKNNAYKNNAYQANDNAKNYVADNRKGNPNIGFKKNDKDKSFSANNNGQDLGLERRKYNLKDNNERKSQASANPSETKLRRKVVNLSSQELEPEIII